jgi:hypothetical protein
MPIITINLLRSAFIANEPGFAVQNKAAKRNMIAWRLCHCGPGRLGEIVRCEIPYATEMISQPNSRLNLTSQGYLRLRYYLVGAFALFSATLQKAAAVRNGAGFVSGSRINLNCLHHSSR